MMGNASGCHLKVPLRFLKLSQPCRHQPLIGRYTLRGFYTLQICVYEEAQSHLEKAADTSNIETDTKEKKGTKQKRKTAMTFCESDDDIVVGDEELYGRYYFDSSNS
ncbi:uncharacterized protein LOC136075132 [Hydra vulgaris]|uniref:Uncharacterized protein LOC136075132 n=1 Tax=Hydra vulgaris TaxID=6087 RepID=A0ABM4B3X1_HYDVU